MVRRLATLAIAATLVSQGWALAADGRFTYGDAWWEEYVADDQTALLLHFGEPAPPAWRRLVVAADENRKERDLFDAGGLGEIEAADDGVELLKPDEPGSTGQKTLSAAAGQVRDASGKARLFAMPEGFAVAPGGRFGTGLEVQMPGRGWLLEGLAMRGVRSLECWFRVEKRPSSDACIVSVDDDEVRLILRPDGRLELRLRRPHGLPHPTTNTPQQLERITARDASIVSPRPIEPGRWVHASITNEPPVVQGAGSPFNAVLRIDGSVAANYLSEVNNGYDFMKAGGGRSIILANNAEGSQPFVGSIDELRISTGPRSWYERVDATWRDTGSERHLQFDRPWFLEDGTVLHASFDRGTQLERGEGKIAAKLDGLDASLLDEPGVRGVGWIIDPRLPPPRVPLRDLSAGRGSLEFWIRPVNWDDHTPLVGPRRPQKTNLSVVRLLGVDRRDGTTKQLAEITLPRAHDPERGPPTIDPGHWQHIVVTWAANTKSAEVYRNGRRVGSVPWDQELAPHADLAAAEFGVTDADVTAARGEPPLVQVDEVVGYRYPLSPEEAAQARLRWMGVLAPIPLHASRFAYKYSIRQLEFQSVPKLPEGVTADTLDVSLEKADGGVVVPPVTASLSEGRFFVVMSRGREIDPGEYRFRLTVRAADGKALVEDALLWKYAPEEWRGNTLGILKTTPPPWNPVRVDRGNVTTLMTRYELSDDGLPSQIMADGMPLLRGPIVLLEDGRPLRGMITKKPESSDIAADWETHFDGESCVVRLAARCEYDGCVRFELSVEPRGTGMVRPLAIEVPFAAARATRWMVNAAGDVGVRTGTVPEADGLVVASRSPAVWAAERQARKRKETPPPLDAIQSYAFLTQIDVNDMDRGLYWFADNARGWGQSRTIDAQRLTRSGDTVMLRLNLVAEPSASLPKGPIVFGMLPHPARRLSPDYRRVQREAPERDPRGIDIWNAFRPWSPDPRSSTFALYPVADPKQPDAGPSWSYAESCVPFMKDLAPKGHRILYLSNYWYGCDAGAYDHWEWRNGPSGQATLSDSLVDYLVHRVNEWIGRGIFDAVYLDDSYEAPSRNVESGQAIALPDGSVQAGVMLWNQRELLKRWRGIFHQHGLEPMLVAHHTRSMMYPAHVFLDAALDGEGHPTITATSPDFVDALSLERAEVLQNGRMWGVTPFFMVSIWEGGLERGKDWNPRKRWSWRMARAAMSTLAHFENGTVFTDQGAEVYRDYWADVLRWGAGDPEKVPFHPYWRNNQYLDVEGQGDDSLVSFYHDPGTRRLLVVASNRRAAPREIRVRLNRETLGLGEPLEMEEWDTGYPPAAGLDSDAGAKAAAETAKELEAAALDRDGDLETELDDLVGEIERENKPPADRIRLEGDVLVLPVRPHDFRMVSIRSRP